MEFILLTNQGGQAVKPEDASRLEALLGVKLDSDLVAKPEAPKPTEAPKPEAPKAEEAPATTTAPETSNSDDAVPTEASSVAQG